MTTTEYLQITQSKNVMEIIGAIRSIQKIVKLLLHYETISMDGTLTILKRQDFKKHC